MPGAVDGFFLPYFMQLGRLPVPIPIPPFGMSTRSSSMVRPSLGMPSGFNVVVRRLVWNVLPVSLVLGVVGVFLLGEDGLIDRSSVKQRLYATQAKVEQARAENEVLRARILMLRSDPRFVKRAAAERLLMAESGATIYRFGGPLR